MVILDGFDLSEYFRTDSGHLSKIALQQDGFFDRLSLIECCILIRWHWSWRSTARTCSEIGNRSSIFLQQRRNRQNWNDSNSYAVFIEQIDIHYCRMWSGQIISERACGFDTLQLDHQPFETQRTFLSCRISHPQFSNFVSIDVELINRHTLTQSLSHKLWMTHIVRTVS